VTDRGGGGTRPPPVVFHSLLHRVWITSVSPAVGSGGEQTPTAKRGWPALMGGL